MKKTIINPSPSEILDQEDLADRFAKIRSRTEGICSHLKTEDFCVQPITDVSPPKWHMAHTTWFFETFVLKKFFPDYSEFDETFGYHFNSYYNTVGERVLRSDRGLMTRPETSKIYAYREYVNKHILRYLERSETEEEAHEIIELGLQHEMQHQELLLTDIKYILGHQPFFPEYHEEAIFDQMETKATDDWIKIPEGIYQIGYRGGGQFHFDNEKGLHKVFLESYEISSRPITFGEYIEFIEAGGYRDFNYWHSDAWDYINKNQIEAPLYMHKINGEWYRYTMSGLKKIKPHQILIHISFYEASAYAEWRGFRLPTEYEWEAASEKFEWGQCWEWTNSAYLPYPRFKKAEGALGEYNGKFMVNQMVLRGGSTATTPGHTRSSYRNFFHPWLQWQFSGIRLAK